MKSVRKPLTKSVLFPLGLEAAGSTTDGAFCIKMFRSVRPLNLALRTTALIISNEEINIMKIVKSLKESNL